MEVFEPMIFRSSARIIPIQPPLPELHLLTCIDKIQCWVCVSHTFTEGTMFFKSIQTGARQTPCYAENTNNFGGTDQNTITIHYYGNLNP